MPFSVKMGGAPDSASPGGADDKAARALRQTSGSGAGLRRELNPVAVIVVAVALLVVAVVAWWLIGAGGHGSAGKPMTFPAGASGPPIPGPPTGAVPSVGSPADAPPHGALGPGGPPIPHGPGTR